jgi:hypothetical protein
MEDRMSEANLKQDTRATTPNPGLNATFGRKRYQTPSLTRLGSVDSLVQGPPHSRAVDGASDQDATAS